MDAADAVGAVGLGGAVPLLNITTYDTFTPTRAVDAANNTRTPIAPIDAVAFLNEPTAVVGERGKRWIQDGVLRVRKNSDGTLPDLHEGDEILLPDGVFGVVGEPTMSRRQSMTGDDFGWARYQIRKGG